MNKNWLRSGGTGRALSAEEQLKFAKNLLSEQMAVAGVAAITNGWTNFLEEPSQAAAIYSRILSDINRRYIVGYYPINKAHDGKRRNVKVEVRGHSEYVVLGNKSYFAPGPDD